MKLGWKRGAEAEGFFDTIGSAIGGYLQNHPVVQVAEGVVDIFHEVDWVEDTDFRDIREAGGLRWLGDDPANVDAGGANVLINVAGEILTDPLTFWAPYGAVKTGTTIARAGSLGAKGTLASRAARGGGTWLKASDDIARETVLATAHAQGIGVLEAGVRTFDRAALTFKLPLLDATFIGRLPVVGNALQKAGKRYWVPGPAFRWAIGMPKSLDLPIARKLAAGVEWMHRMPGTRNVINTFSRAGKMTTAARSIAKSLGETGEVTSVHGSVMRGIARQMIKSGDDAHMEYMSTVEPMLRKAMRSKVGAAILAGDKDLMQVIRNMMELGVVKFDDQAQFFKAIDAGRPYAMAQSRLNTLLNPRQVFAGGAMKEQHIAALRLAEDMKGAADPDEFLDAVASWQKSFPDAKLPDNAINRIKELKKADDLGEYDEILRPGIDTTEDVRGFYGDPTDVRIAGELSPATDVGVAGRAGVAEEVAPVMPDIFEQAKVESKSLYDTLRGRVAEGAVGGKKAKVTSADIDLFVEETRILMDKIGEKDLADGLLSVISEHYIPRQMSDAARELAQNRFSEWLGGLKGAKQKAVADFMKGRKFEHLTIHDVNVLTRIVGIKATGFKALGGKVREVLTGVEASEKAMAGIFNADFIRTLRNVDGDAADFFSSNMFLDWYQRIQKGATARGQLNFMKVALGDDSLLVHRIDDLATHDVDQLRIIGEQEGLVPFLEFEGKWRPMHPGEAIAIGAANSREARAKLATHVLREHTTTEILANRVKVADQIGYIEADASLGGALGATRELEGGRRIPVPLSHRQTDEVMPHLKEGSVETLQGYTPRTPTGKDLKDDWLLLADRKVERIDLEATMRRAGASAEEVASAEKRLDVTNKIISELSEKVKSHRSALRQEASDLRTAREEFATLMRVEKGDKGKRLKEIIKRKLNEGEFAEEFAIHLEQRRRGFNAMEEIIRKATDPSATANAAEQAKYKKIYDKMRARHKGKKIKWLDKQVAEQLFGNEGLYQRIHVPHVAGGTMSDIGKIWDRATNLFKFWTAVPYAASRARDWLSNQVTYLQGGIHPVHLAGAQIPATKLTRLVTKFLDNDPDALQALRTHVIDLGEGRKINGMHLLQHMHANGLLNSGYMADLAIHGGLDVLKDNPAMAGELFRKVAALTGPLAKPITKGHDAYVGGWSRFSNFLDNESRIAGVIADMRSGKTLEEAADTVKAWSYDGRAGRDLSSAEKWIRRAGIPFYTFQKWAWKKQWDALLTRPGTIGAWGKVNSEAQRLTGLSEEEMKQAVPDFLDRAFGIPYGTDDDGNPLFVLLGNVIPLGQVKTVVDAIGRAASGAVGSQSPTEAAEEQMGGGGAASNLFRELFVGPTVMSQGHPAWKIPLQHWANWDHFRQREKRQFPGEKTERFGVEMSPFWASVIDEVRSLKELDNNNIGGIKGRYPSRDKSWWENPIWSPTSILGDVLRDEPYVDVSKNLAYQKLSREKSLGETKYQLRKWERKAREGAPAAESNVEELKKVVLGLKAKEMTARELLKRERRFRPKRKRNR